MNYQYTVREARLEADTKNPINLWFFGDVHRDTESCDVDRWNWFLERAKHDVKKEDTYFFGMGDYNDFASTSERKKIQGNGMHETTIDKFDRLVQMDNMRLADEIGFMKGRILGLIEGNHTWNFVNGTSATEDLAKRMDTEFLGWLSHFTINFNLRDRSNTSQSVHLVLCHGKAGGKTYGVTINQVGDLKAIFPAADIYCMGHDHQRGAWPTSILLPTYGNNSGWKMKQKRQFLCRSGSFKKAYSPDTSSYEVSRLFKPSDLGALKLVLRFHRDKKNNEDRVILDIEAII